MAISCLLRHRDDAASARSLHAAANESTSHESSQAVPQVPTVGLGQALPHLTRTGCIYLDYNATTPIFPEVANEMAPFVFEHFGNPSSGHVYGRACKSALDTARQRVAALIAAASPSEVHFTSCGTESDNWAVYGAVMAARAAAAGAAGAAGYVPHVVASAVEHPAVLAHLTHLQEQGLLSYTLVPVDGEGLVSPADVAAAVTPATCLVTVMHSNNEVGAVQPIAHIAAAARAAHARLTAGGGGATSPSPSLSPSSSTGGSSSGTSGSSWRPRLLVHSDAAQSTGKVDLDVGALDLDLMTLVGHKFGAPKGVAALYVRHGTALPNYFYGGGQEGGRRAGTENVMQVVGLGAAAAITVRERRQLQTHMGDMAQRLLAAVRAQVAPAEQDKLRLNGPADPTRRLPNTLSLSIRGLNSGAALAALSGRLAASAGAACHSSGAASVSAVLRAMKVPTDYATGTLRLSTGRHTTTAEVDEAAGLIVAEARRQGVLAH
ncbi:hypothetical protein CHLRE_07g322000v5 [Chlamydomonas reinhardtii]|uniref:Aminotransferase class V domain-containing protein n=1 Tax=Chlamydomonas reinhardtii TaxID=3055 RepID=A0A2K3DJ46_CHLRE|nr:uncharacterized protein CHLRE_07g322000v5 [Chlamydomonas reinhardtii]PNW80545.1 hypothetical protein CHLRE_07g322000v5 [Chlamydomonas reinhardtii]